MKHEVPIVTEEQRRWRFISSVIQTLVIMYLAMGEIVFLFIAFFENSLSSRIILVVGIPSLFILICYAYSFGSGWHAAAKQYRLDRKYDGFDLHPRRVFLRSMGYIGLRIKISEDGLCLRMVPWLRIGHPPLFIPWLDITIRTEEWRFLFVFMKMYTLLIGRPLLTELILPFESIEWRKELIPKEIFEQNPLE